MKSYLTLCLCFFFTLLSGVENIPPYNAAKSSKLPSLPLITLETCNSKSRAAQSKRNTAERMITNCNNSPWSRIISNLESALENYNGALQEYRQMIESCTYQHKKQSWHQEVIDNCAKEIGPCKKRIEFIENSLIKVKQNWEADEKIQQLWPSILEKIQQADEEKASVIKGLINIKEVSDSLNAAAQLYDEAIISCRQAANLAYSDQGRESFKKDLMFLENKTKACREEAAEWPEKVQAQKKSMKDQIVVLKNETNEEMTRSSWEAHQQMALTLKKLIECQEADPSELVAVEERIVLLENAVDTRHFGVSSFSSDEFYQKEKIRKEQFFASENISQASLSSAVFPLDGPSLYTEQFYRFFVQTDSSASSLKVHVYENGVIIHQEQIGIPVQDEQSWHHYLTTDEMVIIPDSVLKAQFGLDLRINIVSDPNHNLSLLIAHKATNRSYNFTFSLEEEVLYGLSFSLPPPWQLDVLSKPSFPSTDKLLEGGLASIKPPSNDQYREISCELRKNPTLERFVKQMKEDPLALTQYVYNEIELVDPFLTRIDGVFQAPSIHRDAYRTFLEKQGSPWEQCMLLVHLLRQAGYDALYTEGTCSLPSSFVEKLLFVQLPDEKETLLDYPGVLFFDGTQWISLFPWMKEINVIEGYDLYALMPDEYANADRWIRRYLRNDENILKHIRSDGDDSAGILFVRCVEEQLKSKGLSLHDIGTQRIVQKRQYTGWKEFLRPSPQADRTTLSNLSTHQHLLATVKVDITSKENPERTIETGWLPLIALDYMPLTINFYPLSTPQFPLNPNGVRIQLIESEADSKSRHSLILHHPNGIEKK